jgi:putative salt-induced outer membrane protein YdiY
MSIAAMARADVVTLKNGDRVTGTLVTVKDGKLELKSDVLGDLSIPVAQIATFSAEKPVVVMVKGQKPLRGTLELEPSGAWQVTSNGRSQTLAASSAQLIMPEESYSKLIEHTAKPWQDWHGVSSLGYAVQRGDQQTSNFSTTVNAVRERPATPIFERHWRTDYGLTMVFSHAAQDGTSVTSNTYSTHLRQDYLLSPDNFIFGLAQLDHIGAQDLYLRQTYGGGYGRQVLNTPRMHFSVLGGLNDVHEKFFDGSYNQNAEALVGEHLGIKLFKSVALDHSLNFYPNLTNSGQYRFDTTTTVAAKLNNRFSLNASVVDFYLSNPAAGSHKNNIAYTTGLGYTF